VFGLIVRIVIGYAIGNIVAGVLLASRQAAALPHSAHDLAMIAGGVVFACLAWLTSGQARRGVGSTVHGSARFASEKEAKAGLGGPRGLIVGRENRRGGKLMRYAGPAHLLTIAPTRSGKGVGAIIPNLLLADRSVLCIDPKGENARVTTRARRRFGPVHVLDPFGATGLPSAAFNPLDGLDPDSLDIAEDVAALADALVYDSPGQAGEAHWNEEAKALIAGLILHVVCDEESGPRTLATLRDLLTRAPHAWAARLERMAQSPSAGGLVARAAHRQLGKSEREAAGVLSSAQRHTHFLDSPRMTAVLGRSDFRFEDFKEATSTVFLVLPPDRMATHARWLRLMVVQALDAVARSPARPPSSVLFLLDEFAALGRLEPIERAFGLMAGYGLQLWIILQDLHQLRSIYGERAGTFLSNAGLTQIFNVADVDTATWVSRTIGATTEVYETSGTSQSQPFAHWRATFGASSSTHLARRDLLTPDEVMRLGAGLEILLRQGEAPVIAAKVRHYADPEFRGLFDQT
jgi:type IV secretion system protein VirD4